MNSNLNRSTGISLVTASVLAIATMVMHPSGGDVEQIIRTAKPIIQAHSLAIFFLPFMLFGFYGLTIYLLEKYRLSVLAFIIMAFGLIAAMLAALFNGLVLPTFLSRYTETYDQNMAVLKPIMNYGFAINLALDYVFIVAFCMAIMMYSLIIIRSQKLVKWIGYFGLSIFIFALVGAATDFVFTSLTGFRIFVFSIASWIMIAGAFLYRSKEL